MDRCSGCGTPRANAAECPRCVKIKDRFSCPQCPAKFPYKSRLKTHMAVHGAMPLIRCAAMGCKTAFKRKSDMCMHFRAKHLGLYRCDDCGHMALSSQKLATHRRIHTQERPFKCATCGMGFIRKQHLETHRYVHTDTVPPERSCSMCSVSINKRVRVCVQHRLCTTHAVEKGLIAPSRRSVGSLAACRCFDEIERLAGIKIHHIHYSDDDRTFSGREQQGLIPGKRFAPDGVDAESPTHLYEFLGTPWHGYADPDAPGSSHTGRPYWELHAQTIARIHLFADHGYVVHYVWQSEWERAKTRREKLGCIHSSSLGALP